MTGVQTCALPIYADLTKRLSDAEEKAKDTLAANEIVRTAIVELIQNSPKGQQWEISVGPKIGKALVQAAVNDLFKGREASVTLVEEFRTAGLEFRNGAGEVLELSEESVAEVFRRLMSPELSRLVDSRPG